MFVPIRAPAIRLLGHGFAVKEPLSLMVFANNSFLIPMMACRVWSVRAWYRISVLLMMMKALLRLEWLMKAARSTSRECGATTGFLRWMALLLILPALSSR